MSYNYEFLMGDEPLPVKAILGSVNEYNLHWHNKIEIIFVLEGSVNVSVDKAEYVIQENDIILINTGQLHSFKRTEDKNTLLAIQIEPEFYNNCFPKFKNMRFHCRSLLQEGREKYKFDVIRHYIANIIWCLNEKDKGYELIIGSYLCLLGGHLINNFDYDVIEDKKYEVSDRDIIRIRNIMNYANENMGRNITLKEIAEKEHLNYHFLSHFIKDKIGISFQDYLNSIRLKKAVGMIINSDETITNIAHLSGFSSINSFNRLFKREYKSSPTEYRADLLNSRYKGVKVINSNRKFGTFLEVDMDAAFNKLYYYLSIPKTEGKE